MNGRGQAGEVQPAGGRPNHHQQGTGFEFDTEAIGTAAARFRAGRFIKDGPKSAAKPIANNRWTHVASNCVSHTQPIGVREGKKTETKGSIPGPDALSPQTRESGPT